MFKNPSDFCPNPWVIKKSKQRPLLRIRIRVHNTDVLVFHNINISNIWISVPFLSDLNDRKNRIWILNIHRVQNPKIAFHPSPASILRNLLHDATMFMNQRCLTRDDKMFGNNKNFAKVRNISDSSTAQLKHEISCFQLLRTPDFNKNIDDSSSGEKEGQNADKVGWSKDKLSTHCSISLKTWTKISFDCV